MSTDPSLPPDGCSLPRTRRATAGALSLAIMLALAGLAPASAANADDREAAEDTGAAATEDPAGYTQLIEQAVKEFRLAHYPEARSLFEQAHALQPSARTLRGMGLSALEERAYVLAIQHRDRSARWD